MRSFARLAVASLPRVARVAAVSTVAVAVSTAAVVIAAPEAAPQATFVDYDAVRKDIASILDTAASSNYDDGSYGPLFVRLAWHAAGTYSAKDGSGGSNGGMMRFHPEAAWGANAGLKLARDLLEKVKAKYPGLSYADLYTLSGVVAVEEMGGPKITWRPGRVDFDSGSRSPPDGRLPDASKGVPHLRDIFHRMGFNDKDIVALSGAHSLGRCHTDRSGFSGPWTFAPTTVSNEYFVRLIEDEWVPKQWSGPAQYEDKKTGQLMMLPSDLALLDDPVTRKYVYHYAENEKAWRDDFANAFSKLLELGVPFSKK